MQRRPYISKSTQGLCSLFSLIVTASCLITHQAHAESPAGQSKFPENVNLFLSKYCYSCHGPDKTEGSLRLDNISQDLVNGLHGDDWHEALDALRFEEMPPEDEKKQPSQKERQAMIAFLEEAFEQAAKERRSTGGRIVLRRLTNYEYDNTLNDLLALNGNFSVNFPPDSTSEDGFKNNGQFMGMSAMQIDNYYEAASQALDQAIHVGKRPVPKLADIKGPQEFTHQNGKDRLVVKNDPTSAVQVLAWRDYPHQGEAIIDITLSGVRDPDPISKVIQLQIGHRQKKKGFQEYQLSNFFDVEPSVTVKGDVVHLQYVIPKIEVFPLPHQQRAFQAGKAWKEMVIQARITASSKAGKRGKKGDGNGQIRLESMKAKADYYETWPPESHRRIFISSKNESNEAVYAREVLTSFMTRAWRRAVTAQEVDEAYAYYQTLRRSGSFLSAIKESLVSVLMSPNFMFLVEQKDPSGKSEKLSSYELANRLSYFLWSTKPDDRLSSLAASGKITSPETLRAEVRRLISDDRSWRFIEHFTSQWLGLERMDVIAVNPEYYPDFNDELKQDMKEETYHFMAHLLHENKSALNLIDSDFTFASERLQQHYGRRVSGPLGKLAKKVAVEKELGNRGGILGHASIHFAYSDGADSHPVVRGVWLVDKILGNPPPSPPAEVEFDETIPGFEKMSKKQQLEAHLQTQSCKSCHEKFDPYGVAFENFNAVGGFRQQVRKINHEEYQQKLAEAKREDPEVSFKKIDADNSGYISEDEWLRHAKASNSGQNKDMKRLKGEFNKIAGIVPKKLERDIPDGVISSMDWQRHVLRLEQQALAGVQKNVPYHYIKADPTTVLPDGTKVAGLDDLKAYLLEHKRDEFAENMVRQILTYALGRSLEFSDQQAVDRLTRQFKAKDYRMASLLEEIAVSDLFLTK